MKNANATIVMISNLAIKVKV